MAKQYFEGVDLAGFWNDSEYALKKWVSPRPDDTLIASVEQELGYRLPGSFVALMKVHNGGMPARTCFPTSEATSWAEDHIAITGIFGIGRKKDYTLCGGLGSKFRMEEWGYPDIGVYFGNCPSAGHDMIVLDYRKAGRTGEPCVAHVDQDREFRVTWLAPDFESFIRGLVDEERFT